MRVRLYYLLFISQEADKISQSLILFQTLYKYGGGVPGHRHLPVWSRSIYEVCFIFVIDPLLIAVPFMAIGASVGLVLGSIFT